MEPILASCAQDGSGDTIDSCRPRATVRSSSAKSPHQEVAEFPQRLLIVEDDDLYAMLVKRALGDGTANFQITHARQLDEAFARLNAGSYDLILLDLSLPDSLGLEGIDRMRVHSPRTPIVVLTALDDHQLALQALGRGAQDYLVKGAWSRDSLVRTLRYAIQRQEILAENQRLLAELQRQSRVDSLTNLLNRSSFNAELTREWSRASRTSAPLSCILFDIDFFKHVNDTRGHSTGDSVLQAVARLLESACRQSDTMGRYGGEEFCVLLPDTREGDAVTWAERLRQRIAAMEVAVDGQTASVTASFGVVENSVNVPDPLKLVDLADKALLAAKRMGRNRVVAFSELHGSPDSAIGPLGRLTVREIMSPLTDVIRSDATLLIVADRMLAGGHDAIAIVDEHGCFMGVICEEDLTRRMTSAQAWLSVAGDIVNRRAVSFHVNDSALEVYNLLLRGSLRRAVVVEHDQPVGMVHRSNLLRWFREQQFGPFQ